MTLSADFGLRENIVLSVIYGLVVNMIPQSSIVWNIIPMLYLLILFSVAWKQIKDGLCYVEKYTRNTHAIKITDGKECSRKGSTKSNKYIKNGMFLKFLLDVLLFIFIAKGIGHS